MGPALIGLIGIVLGAAGGFLTARQQGHLALKLALANAEKEREQQLRQLAVEITKLELERRPDAPYMAGEYVAVLTRLLGQLDVGLGVEGAEDAAVERFRISFCASCGQALAGDAAVCPSCGWPARDRPQADHADQRSSDPTTEG
jgi:hypothetical protein